MKTETLEIDGRFGEEYAGRYVFQEISWAKRNRIIQKYTKYHGVTGQVLKSDYVAIQAETIWASLKEQPEEKPITLDRLLSEEDGVPIELGELFSQVANKLTCHRMVSGVLLDDSVTFRPRNLLKNVSSRIFFSESLIYFNFFLSYCLSSP